MATFVRRRVTIRVLGSKMTPFKVIFNRKTNLSFMLVFGCRYWNHPDKEHVDKLDESAREATLIRHTSAMRGSKLRIATEQKFTVSRDVKFKNVYSGSSMNKNSDGKA